MNTQTQKTNWGNLSLGVLGLLILCFASMQPVTLMQKTAITLGCVLLLISSILEKNRFFTILEILAVLSASIAFLPIHAGIKTAIFAIAGLISVIYLIKKGILKSFLDYIGGAGLLFLALGFAVSNPLIYFAGGFFLIIYSLHDFFRGAKIALIFAILNAFFIISAGIGVYRMLITIG